ncbi:MAG: hypothetical protein AAF283_00505 [Cyanobacteria bacterium P01_A01_bin.70]
MARSLDQISTDLTTLATSTSRIDDDLKALYQEYLTVLGKAVKRQLVLAVYHLCTQAYPNEFLVLSVSQREQVQTGVRKIAAQGQTQIKQLGQVFDLSTLADKLEAAVAAKYETTPEEETEGETPAAVDESADNATVTNIGAENPVDLDESQAQEDATLTDETLETPTHADETPAADGATMEIVSQEASEMIQRLSTSLSLFAVFGSESPSPISLAKRHVLLERHLRAVLKTLSSLANLLLKQVNILPDLPEMVIAAAAEAEAGEPGPSTPNLLNVLVELGGDRPDDDQPPDLPDDDDDNDDDALPDDDEEFDTKDSGREMTHLIAINLRLADIEFSDPHTALWRSRLQETLHKLKRLGEGYQKLQQEKARAEAEHAWRATWFEE